MTEGGCLERKKTGISSWDPSFGGWSSSITIEGPPLLGKQLGHTLMDVYMQSGIFVTPFNHLYKVISKPNGSKSGAMSPSKINWGNFNQASYNIGSR